MEWGGAIPHCLMIRHEGLAMGAGSSFYLLFGARFEVFWWVW